MREWIIAFLDGKQGLSSNSKQSYKYDLEQFLDMIGVNPGDSRYRFTLHSDYKYKNLSH